VVLPLCYDIIGILDQKTYLLAFGWNIELHLFGSLR
jgi:hypothetical protein